VIVLAGTVNLSAVLGRNRCGCSGAAAAIPPAPTRGARPAVRQAAANAVANAAVETARRDLTARLDDLEKRLAALSAVAAESRTGSDPAVAELRSRVEALRPPGGRAVHWNAGRAARNAGAETDKEIAVLRARSPPCTPPCRRSTRV